MLEVIIGSTECLWTGLTTIILALASFYAFYYIFKNQYEGEHLFYFCLFWFAVAIGWFFNGIRLFFAYFGNFGVDKILFEIGEVFSIFFQPLFGGLLLIDRMVKNKHSKAVLFLIIALYFGWATFSIMSLPLAEGPTSVYRTNYIHGEEIFSWASIEYGLFMLIFLWIFDLFRSIFRKMEGRIRPDLVSILTMFSIFIYAVMTFFNERIVLDDWTVIGVRGLMLTGPFLAVLAVYYLRREKAIKKLTMALEEVRKGNFNVKIDITTRDEIEKMAEAFNKMIEEIKEYQSQLEQTAQVLEIRVKARTKQLEEEKANLDLVVKERTKELENRINELEKFHQVTVGRELKMIELKEKNKELERKIQELEKKLKEK